jgi:hypothetical protein
MFEINTKIGTWPTRPVLVAVNVRDVPAGPTHRSDSEVVRQVGEAVEYRADAENFPAELTPPGVLQARRGRWSGGPLP